MKLLLLVCIFSNLLLIAPPAVLASEPINLETADLSIDNFERVSQSIWRGAAPSDLGLQQLAGHGVKTIIDLRLNGGICHREEQTASGLGIRYIHLPMGFRKPTYADVTKFLKIVSDPLNLPVFIHCHQGADRTGVLVGIYRILVENWTFDHTYNEMRLHHFKPWLFGMKKSVLAVSKDNSIRKVLQAAIENGQITIIDSSEAIVLNHPG